MKKDFRKAFTLIELLVVVAIIGILATVVVLNVSSARAKAVEANLVSGIADANKAVALCKAREEGTLNTTITPGALVCNGDSMVTTKWPDTTGTAFSYSSPCDLSLPYSCSISSSSRKLLFSNTGVGKMEDKVIATQASCEPTPGSTTVGVGTGLKMTCSGGSGSYSFNWTSSDNNAQTCSTDSCGVSTIAPNGTSYTVSAYDQGTSITSYTWTVSGANPTFACPGSPASGTTMHRGETISPACTGGSGSYAYTWSVTGGASNCSPGATTCNVSTVAGNGEIYKVSASDGVHSPIALSWPISAPAAFSCTPSQPNNTTFSRMGGVTMSCSGNTGSVTYAWTYNGSPTCSGSATCRPGNAGSLGVTATDSGSNSALNFSWILN